MARFFPLTVTHVRRETRNAVVVTLEPDLQDQQTFEFIQGQYLTFKREFDGTELRRSYSICTGRNEGVLRVGIKRVDGGSFSSWANDELKVGDVIDTMPPMGKFHTPLKPLLGRRYAAFAAGSGITPILSLVKTTLAEEPKSRFTLVYGNRSTSSIMFREELEDLKNTYMQRFRVMHILGNEAQDIELFSGRIDATKCSQLFSTLIDVASLDIAYICGPEPMMLTVSQSLRDHGLNNEQIKYELFASSQPGRLPRAVKTQTGSEGDERCMVSLTLDGTTHELDMSKSGESVLEAAISASLDAPFACKAGVCSTCRAMVLEGEVEMIKNHALEDYEIGRGYVLTCQCYPLSDRVVISYDQ